MSQIGNHVSDSYIDGDMLNPNGINLESVGIDLNGNLNISGSARRIIGDFSNANISDRVMFQTSGVNSGTGFGVIPNGSSVYSSVVSFGSSDPSNSSYVALGCSGGLYNRITSSYTGSAVNLPLHFHVGGSDRLTINVDGNVSMGGTLVQGSATGFRNKLINGDMRVHQRGSVTPSLGSVYHADRWCTYSEGAAPTSVINSYDETASSIPGCTNLLIAYGNAGNSALKFFQFIEAKNAASLNRKVCTLSAWIYTKDMRTVTIYISHATVENQPAGAAVFHQQSFPGSGWRKITTTTPSIPVGATKGIIVDFSFGSVPASVDVSITQVQLEEGSVATPFEHRPYGLELALCQRYYERCGAAVGTAYPNAAVNSNRVYNPSSLAGNITAQILYKVTKRTIPTVSHRYDFSDGAQADGAPIVNSVDGFLSVLSVPSGGWLDINDWQASAEL